MDPIVVGLARGLSAHERILYYTIRRPLHVVVVVVMVMLMVVVWCVCMEDGEDHALVRETFHVSSHSSVVCSRFRDFSSWTVRGATLSVVLVRSHGHKVRVLVLVLLVATSLAATITGTASGYVWWERMGRETLGPNSNWNSSPRLAPINLQIRSTTERLLQVERDGRKSIGWTPKTSYKMPQWVGKVPSCRLRHAFTI